MNIGNDCCDVRPELLRICRKRLIGAPQLSVRLKPDHGISRPATLSTTLTLHLMAVPGAINQRCWRDDALNTIGQCRRIPISCIWDSLCHEEKQQMTSPRDLCVASYNIHKGVGTDRRRDLARTMAVISEIGADILALQEADTRFGTRTGLLDLESIRRDLGLIAVPLEGVGDAHGWHGNLLLVRNALVHEVHQLILPGFEPRGALVTDMVIAGQPLRVVNAHLGLLPGSRAAQALALIDKLGSLKARPTLLMGDLNEWRGTSAALKTFGKQFTIAHPRPSFPARYPLLALDRMMTCIHGELLEIATHDSPLARRASDHLPITARLRLAPQTAEGL